MSVFDDARARINQALIEAELAAEGAYWEGEEYWCLNPLREDTRVGSFSINGSTGAWMDFAGSGDAEQGDLIDLISRRDNVSKRAAAEYIVERSGGTVTTPPSGEGRGERKDRPKPKPVIPVPSDRLKALNDLINGRWYRENRGKPVAGWRYHTAEGAVAFCVVRFEKPDGSKDVLPFAYYEDGRWHGGQPFKDGRPLYNLNEIAADDTERPVLVVEGEKAADAAAKALAGEWIVTTWVGGSKAVTRADWSPLADRPVTVWPDADDPGRKAADEIKSRLPHATVLSFPDRSDGWDAADAVAEGEDLRELIAGGSSAHPPAAPPAADEDDELDTRDMDGLPFLPLGHSDTAHWFLLGRGRILYSVPRSSASRHAIELAPLSWWSVQGMVTETNNLRRVEIEDMLVRMSNEQGRYEPERVRGAGVWREDEGEIVVNDGRKIVAGDGQATAYGEFDTHYYYVSSDARFGQLSGEIATIQDGQKLFDLFVAQQFASDAVAASALGWALIAPFGGLLHWRPHVWITGRKGSGKTYTVENLIKPLCGPFAYHGSGKDSEAGIRRSLRTDARPVILDEMEPRTKKEQERIESKIELARNASSDASGYITLASKDGGVDKFSIRSCFCFASVQIPSQGAAIDSRFTRCEFRPVIEEETRKERTRELIHVLDDPARFRRRTFRYLPEIVADIDHLRDVLPAHLSSQREADQLAPLMAVVWWLTHDTPIRDDSESTVLQAVNDFKRLSDDSVEDEDRMVQHLLQGRVRTDDNHTRTVGELLRLLEHANETTYAEEHLSRVGIRVMDHGVNGHATRVLAIATRSDAIADFLRETPYQAGYDAQLRRNPLVLSDDTEQVRMNVGRMRCRLLDWRGFYRQYIGGDEQEEFELE